MFWVINGSKFWRKEHTRLCAAMINGYFSHCCRLQAHAINHATPVAFDVKSVNCQKIYDGIGSVVCLIKL